MARRAGVLYTVASSLATGELRNHPDMISEVGVVAGVCVVLYDA